MKILKIKYNNYLKALIISFASFVSSTGVAQLKKHHMLNVNDKDWKEYEILPLHKKVRFLPIETKQEFDAILSKYAAKNLEVNFDYFSNDEKLKFGFGLQDFNFSKIKFYSLPNGAIAVDRYDVIKATPYFICESLKDFKLIYDYLLMYFLRDGTFITQCQLVYDQFKIKNFLQTEPLKLIKEKSDSAYLLFATKDGKYIQVQYYDRRKGQSPGFESYIRDNPDLQNEDIIYSTLTIYESLDVMNKLGIFDRDYFEIDEENFDSYSKTLFISEKKSIKSKILNKKDLSIALKNKVKEISEKFKDSFNTTSVLSDGSVVAQYSPYIYIQFNNESDFRTYLSHIKNDLGEDYESEPQYDYFNDKIKDCLNDKTMFGLFAVDTANKTLEESLSILDKKVNKFFFDNYFIKTYLASIAVQAGNLIIQKEGGAWKYDKRINRMVIANSNKQLDFTVYFYTEFLRQKYTGSCYIESIISGLLIGSRLNVVPFIPPPSNN